MKPNTIYKLKEEAKPYFMDEGLQHEEHILAWWLSHGVSEKALEPVFTFEPEKIEVIWSTYSQRLVLINNNDGTPYAPTEQERQDIERLLNLGGFEGLNKLADDWVRINWELKTFDKFLKEKGL